MESNNKRYPKGKLGWLWENIKGYRALYIIVMIGSIVYQMLSLTIPYFSGQIVDLFLSGENAADNLLNNRAGFYRLLGLMVGLTALRSLVVYGDCMGYEYVSLKVHYRIRVALYEKIQRQDMSFYNTYRTGDLMTRVTGDLDSVRHMVTWVVRMVIESFSLFFTTAAFFFYLNWKMALCLLTVSPFVFIIIFFFRKEVSPMHKLRREKFSQLNTCAQENISGNKVVKAFAREDFEIEKFDLCNTDFRDTARRTQRVWQKYFPYVNTICNLLPFILLLVGGIFMIRGEMTMGQYVSFSGLTWAITNPMQQMGNIMNEWQNFSASADKVMEIYYSEAGIRDPEDAISHPEPFEGKIEFDHVDFQYEDGDIPVLYDINFTAEPGETIAIMGETGCGKTTLTNLLPRFFEPTSGEVRIDGIPVNRFKLEELRKNIGIATQDVLLYSDSIEGNISFGDLDLSHEDVVKFAGYSQAADFIDKMPEGYETIVGERGVGLSGGQKQRISLARALAIRPSILILDDTTSAVDMETEKLIQEALGQLDFTCTKIIIAQRISSVKDADKIMIMQHGRITESGTHEELLRKKGYYYELVKLQTGLSDDEL